MQFGCGLAARRRALGSAATYFAEVLRSPAQVKSRFVFCSRECHYRGRSMGLVCRIVTQPYTVTDEGRKAWQEAAKKRAGIPRKELVTWVCEVCGKESSITRGNLSPSRKLRFCSPQCANKANRGAGNTAWRGGHPEYYGSDWRPLQRQARKADAYQCQRCGVQQKELGRALDVHHIRPVSYFDFVNDANFIENVVSLCHDCHMLVEWNGVDFELPNRCNGSATATRRTLRDAQKGVAPDAAKRRQ